MGALTKYGFIVDTITCDGASENRSVLKSLCTYAATDLIFNELTELCPELLSRLPPDFKIAFDHPTLPGIKVFAAGDMPYLIKKIVNAMERTGQSKSKTSLSYLGQRLSLDSIKTLWEETGDGKVGTSLRVFKYTIDHFLKNAFNRMRVHLATQITSLSTCRLIDQSNSTKFTKEDLAPMQKIIFALDQLIDIMNATSNHNGVKKMGEKINSPTHWHLVELLETLALFNDWKKEAGKFKERFITSERFENLTWMIFAVVGVSITYLSKEKIHVFDQGRSGSDCCEHHFGNIRMRYNSANQQNCEHATAKATTSRSCTFTTQARTNTSGARKETKTEVFAPLFKKGTEIK